MKTKRIRVREFGVFGMLTVAAILAPWRASGAPYYWNVTGGGNWSDSTRWNPNTGYPGAGDNANFTGAVAQTVNIANGNQAVSNLSVAGSAAWIWNTTGITNLNLSGTFTYDGTSTNSQFAAPIVGNGTMIVNTGRLMLCPAATLTNGFGAVIVNGGTLTSGKPGNGAVGTNSFGNPNAIIQVGALAGTNDAVVEFGANGSFYLTYPQPIVIRAGSSGRATLRYYNVNGTSAAGPWLGGGITLYKDVHLVSATYYGAHWWRNPAYDGNLEVSGPITGAGNVYLDDIFNIVLSGTNSYMGQTIVNANHVWVNSSANANTGAITIARGSLYAKNDGALGAAENKVTLGGPGTLGTLGMSTVNAIVPCLRAITLAGNGGVISGWKSARPYLYGPITGAGKLIVGHDREQGVPGAMYGTNNYSGGTLVVDGCMLGGTNTAFGTGDIEVKLNGSIAIFGSTNIGPGAKVLVKRNPLMDACGQSGGDLGLYLDTVPNIATNSNGKLSINFTGSTNVNAWLQNGSQPIGDGTMFLSSWNFSTITATGLAALVANDPTHTYRLGTSWSASDNITMHLKSSNTTVGALADIGGQPYNVQVGRPNVGGKDAMGAVDTDDDQQFSGTLTIWPGTYAKFLMSPGAGANCVGATNGNIALNGSRDDYLGWRTLWIVNSANVPRTVSKNDLQINGSVCLTVDANSATPTWTTTVQVATLTRNGRSTLSLRGERSLLGNYERFTVANGVSTINGMAAPWLWNDLAGTFLDYGATGFATNLWDGTTLASATGTSKINLGATEQIPAGGVALYALRSIGFGVLANGAAVLTNNSGGVLLGGAGTTNEATMDFGANEAVVITRDASSTHFFNGPLKGSGGLTKTGRGALVLNANNTALTGGIVVNQGALHYTNWMHLGYNTVTLNGGSLRLRGTWTAPAPSITNNIILGPCGGIIGGTDNGSFGRCYGSISGSGWVQYACGWGYDLYGISTYTGGTYVEGMSGLNLYTNDALGTGPLCMGVGQGSTDLNNNNSVNVWHDRALNTNTFIEMKTRSSWLFLQSANPLLGSVEGNGFITLGCGATGVRATFGLDNRDAEYFGQIEQDRIPSTDPPCHIVKAGAGTWTWWGLVTVNGSVTVTNGTLRVNNWVNTDAKVFVYPGATLDGIGTVGVVSNLGGTVQGSLYMRQLVMNSASKFNVTLSGTNAVSQYGQLHISDGLTLGGSTLNLTLSNFKPLPGQSFTILSNSGTASGTQFACGQIVTATAAGGKTYFFRVSYGGGAGGDIVLTALSQGTVVTIR